jgi:hypothetical protein
MNAAATTGIALVALALGVLWSTALFPAGSLSLPTRLACVFGLGYSVPALSGTLLTVAHAFTSAFVAAVLAAAAIVPLVICGRRGIHPRALLADAAAQIGEHRLALGAGLAVVALMALARVGVPMGATAGGWRYWADGLELASVGHVPSVTLQWGTLNPPAVSKLAANAWSGELSFILLRHPFAAMAASLWLSAAGYVTGLWALAWEAGLRRTAPLLPLLGVAGTHLPLVSVNQDIVTKLQFFQDEDMGRTLAVISCAVAFAAMRERRGRTAPVVAGVLLAAAALTHLIPVVAACALLVPYVIAFGVASRDLGRGIAVAAWTIGLAGLMTVASLLASGANLGFQGASGGAGYTDYRGRYDPTLAFKGVLAPPRPKAVHRWYEPPATTAHAYLEDALGGRAGNWRLSFVAVALVVLAAVAVALGPYDLRALAVAAVAMGLLLLAVALAFSYHYAYYIQATFGERRLLEYGALPILLIVLTAAESVLDRVDGFDGRAAAVATVAILLAVLAASAGDLRGGLGGLGPNADFVNAARIATPCDARILPDISTRGSFQALTGRASLLEGLAPFLRPDVLRRTLVLTEQARRFLHDPRGDTRFLAREHIDDVLVDRGGGRRWQRFDHTPGLRLVRQVGGVRVYRYTGPGAGKGGARPADAPGYTCQSGALA